MTYQRTPMDLDIWLLMATEGLTAEADRRVRAEITAHYQDALDEGRGAGLSEAEAVRAAVAGLGDPEAARKQFRKAYLWQRDVERLKALERWRTRTLKEQMQALAAGICVCIICFLALRYWFGLKWVAPMSGAAPALGLWCADVLNGLRARFVFSPPAQDAERRFRNAVTWFWGVMILLPLSIFWLLAVLGEGRASQGAPERSVTLSVFGVVTVAALALWRLLATRECDIYIPLMRKVREKERLTNDGGPDQYA